MFQSTTTSQAEWTAASGGLFQGIGSLSEKEVLYLSDFLSWEKLAIQKCQFMAAHAQDAEVKTLIQSIGQKHEQHYRTLLQQLH